MLKSIYAITKRAMFAALFLQLCLPLFGQAPGVFVDGNHPSGPPDPNKLDLVWNVDSLTGTLTVKIPFPTTPQGGRGPKVPFFLLYNSASTVTLQTTTAYYIPSIAPTPDGGSTIQTYSWAPGWVTAESAPVGPLGPWTTSGSYTTIGKTTVPSGLNCYNGVCGNYTYGCTIYGPYSYTAPDGSSHDLNLLNAILTGPSNASAPPCQPLNLSVLTGSTGDGSTMLTSLNGVVYPEGTTDQGGALEDTNGNEATLKQAGSSFVGTDSEQREAFTTTLPVDFEGVIAPGSYTVTTAGALGPQSQPETYTITFVNAPIGSFQMAHPVNAEDFDCGGINVSCTTEQPVPGAVVSFVHSVSLPDGQSAYTFTPDTTYGTISMITFPTGGYVRFCYTVRANGTFSPNMFLNESTIAVSDVFLSAVAGTNPPANACATAQANEEHWKYADTSITTAGTLTNTVTAPDGTTTQYTGTNWLPGALSQFQMGRAATWLETQRLVFNSAGSLVESVATAYNNVTGIGSLPVQVTTTLYDAGSPLQEQVQYKYDSYSNVVEKDESAFYGCSGSPCPVASTPPGGWLRKTFTGYQYQINSQFLQAHIVNKANQVLVTDGSGHPYSLTVYGYDESTLGGAKGYTGHDDAKYPPGAVGLPRGNVTSEQRCSALANSGVVTLQNASSACATWLVTKHTYDLAGQLLSTTDPNGYKTSYSYTDKYVDGGTGLTTDAYVTTVTHPDNLLDAYTYYYSIGRAAAHTDENSQTTSYGYNDNLNRLKTITDPPTTDGTNGANGVSASGTTTYNYSDTPDAFQVTAATVMTGSTSLTNTTNYDGLGRVMNSQLMNAYSGGASTVAYTYDPLGRVFSVSNAYYTTSDPTYGLTYYCYDAIGRKVLQVQPDNGGSAPNCASTTATYTSGQYWSYLANSTVGFTDENGNQWQRTSDVLGRLIKVLEPTGSSQAATIETDYSYDLLGNLIGVTQCGAACPASGAVNRQFSYDSVSRLVQSYNPETGWTCYGTSGAIPNGANCRSGYDGNGNLLSKTDSRGVVVNYTYDKVNRLLSKRYSNDGNKTPSSCFQYTSASVSNGKGRLAAEWTQSASAGACAATPPSTGVWSRRSILAYDAMGRMTSEQQCTPYNCSSGSPYAPTYTYDLAGNPIGSTNGITSTPVVNTLSLTNLFDQAGRFQGLLSNWTDATHPTTLYSAQTATATPCAGSQTYPFAAFGGLLNASYGGGLTLNRGHDTRLRTTCENDTGSLLTSATSATATVAITGEEQSK
jgi:YD repeat-containing protein